MRHEPTYRSISDGCLGGPLYFVRIASPCRHQLYSATSLLEQKLDMRSRIASSRHCSTTWVRNAQPFEFDLPFHPKK